MTASRSCRFCDTPLDRTFVDLGSSPLSNAYLRKEDLLEGEVYFPLRVYVCEACWLVQLPAFEAPEKIFGDYAYFSSYSDSWLQHARRYVDMMTERFEVGSDALVVEIASNDGYLLQYFKERQVPVLGVEPAANVARVAREDRGIDTVVKFFGVETARELVSAGRRADVLLGNNVLAHVPDLNDFVAGLRILLAEDGVLTMEFPHLVRLIEGNQFDTIYHEHFSYLSLLTVEKIFSEHGLRIFDVEELPTHGGSLRIFAAHDMEGSPELQDSVQRIRQDEIDRGLHTAAGYEGFSEKVQETKLELLRFLIDARAGGKRVVGYGAPAKGNTLLNYCGIRPDLIDFTVDRSPHKQDLYLPGTRIPIHSPDRIRDEKPDFVLILPWNLKEEIAEQMKDIREWGGKFVVPIPEVEIF